VLYLWDPAGVLWHNAQPLSHLNPKKLPLKVENRRDGSNAPKDGAAAPGRTHYTLLRA